MTVQLSTLRVSAEMDASKYQAGAQQKAAADKLMVASSHQVGATATQTDAKLSQSGDVLSRLSRGYVEGYRSAEKFEQGLRQLNRGLDTGKISMTQAEAILVGMNQKLGMSANAAEIASRGQTQLATAVKLANAQLEQQVVVAGRVRGANDNEASFRRRNLTYQLFDVGQMAALGQAPAMLAMQQGPQILQLYAGQGGIKAALSDSVGLAARLIRTMGPLALVAGAGAAAIASMRGEIEKTTGKAVTFGEVATSVFKTIASDIYGLVEPAVDAIAPWFEAAWDKVSAGAILAGNTIINSFTAAFVDIGYVWKQFPNMMGALMTGAANAVIKGTEAMLNTLAGYLDPLILKLNAIFDRMSELSGGRFKGHIDPIGTFDFDQLPNPYEDELRRATTERNGSIRRIMERDPLGDYYRSVRDRVGAGVRTGGIAGERDPWQMGSTNLRDVNEDAIRRMNDALKDQKAIWEDIRETGMDAIDSIVGSALQGFDNIQEVIAGIAKDILKQFTEVAVANPLKNAIYGAGLPTLDNVGGIGGFFKTLMGGGMQGDRSAAVMNVTAATVVINGGAGGALGDVTRLLNPANQNDAWGGLRGGSGGPPPFLAGIGSPGGAKGNSLYRDAIASIESAGSGNYSAIGPTHATLGRALGRYQIMEANVGPWSQAALGRSLTPGQFMANPGLQDSIFDHRFGGYVSQFGERGAAQAWFGGPGSVGKLGRSDVLGTTVGDYGDKFVATLDKLGSQAGRAGEAVASMATNAIDATSGLGTFGQGLNQVGTALAQAPAGGGGGGLFDWIGKLFGGFGGGGTGSGIVSPRAFASGTESAPPGWAWVGERGPELMRMRGGETIRSNSASAAMTQPRKLALQIINAPPGYYPEVQDDSDDTTERFNVTFSKIAAGEARRHGSPLNKTLRGMGARQPRIRRS